MKAITLFSRIYAKDGDDYAIFYKDCLIWS